MGGAVTALGQDPTLVWINPAAVSSRIAGTLSLGGQRGFFGDLTGQMVIAAPLHGAGGFASLLFYESPPVRLAATDGSVRSVTAQQDVVGSLGAGYEVWKGLTLGLALNGIQSRLFEEVSGRSLAVSAGAQYNLTGSLKLGASVRHAGPSIRWLDDPVPLPLEIRAGFAAAFRTRDGNEDAPGDVMVCSADGVWSARERLASLRLGAEYRWLGIIALRAGAALGGPETLNRFSAGAGFQNGGYRLDYAFRFTSEFASPHALCLTLSF